METASIVASFVSTILGGVAFFLAIYFYNQSKNTERNVQVALEGIRTQTEALQSLNARTLDRLTKFVTTPREEPTQSTQLLVATLRDIPEMVLRLRAPVDTSTEDALRREIVSTYILLWHYIGTCNIWIATHLPAPADFDEADSYHQLVRSMIDRSAEDFAYLEETFSRISSADIRASPYFDLYQETVERVRGVVGDTAQNFTRHSQP